MLIAKNGKEVDLTKFTKYDIIDILNDLVYMRFTDIRQLKKHLEQEFGCKIELVQSWKNSERDEYDYLMVGHIETDEVFCDFDIYYAKSKNHILITEVSYEFE